MKNDLRLPAIRYGFLPIALGDFKVILESDTTLVRKYIEERLTYAVP